MGGNGSTSRKVSFGLDENEKVTVMEGVKLSNDVLRRMRDSQGTDGAKPHKPPPSPKPTGPSSTEVQEEFRKNFERHQALVQEQLARLAQKERETAGTQGLGELTPALLMEKGKAHEEQEKAKILPADVDAWWRTLRQPWGRNRYRPHMLRLFHLSFYLPLLACCCSTAQTAGLPSRCRSKLAQWAC
uniref:MICOS complex subunit mic25-a-like isoform X4 n=1 Tax=Gasterosteus aculeatus aculeatus TaxID=481459 RepID=UPI001A995415|nr:MICOS complex subunit mic25-a-like isoform X4 [Gasterosteus aculeatus aculeatus]